MKVFLFTLLISLTACHTERPLPAMCDTVQGVWKEDGQPNFYTFDNGYAIQRLNFAAGGIVVLEYGYECDGNKMNLREFQSGLNYTWTITFPTDSTAQVIMPLETKILKRFP
jgi:hypothetical protein